MATRMYSISGPSGYVLEPLRESADFILYRGRQHGNPLPVLVIAPSAEQPSPQNLRRVEHEYSLAAELDPAWAVSLAVPGLRYASGCHDLPPEHKYSNVYTFTKRQFPKYEPGTIVAEKDFVIVHDRFSGKRRPANWIAADIVRIEDGILVEHWDVLQVPRRNRLTSSRPVARRLC